MDEKIIEGIAASSGMSVGPVFIYQPPDLTIPNLAPESAEGELERFDQAVEQARSEIQDIKEKILLRSGQENAAIFDAHMLMLDDPMLVSKVRDYVDANKNIEQALSESTKELAGMLAAMEDEYFAARAADMEDVGRRVLRILLRVEDTSLDALFAPSIIIAQDLTPSDTAKLDPELVLHFFRLRGDRVNLLQALGWVGHVIAEAREEVGDPVAFGPRPSARVDDSHRHACNERAGERFTSKLEKPVERAGYRGQHDVVERHARGVLDRLEVLQGERSRSKRTHRRERSVEHGARCHERVRNRNRPLLDVLENVHASLDGSLHQGPDGTELRSLIPERVLDQLRA